MGHINERCWLGKELALLVPGIAKANCYVLLVGVKGFEPLILSALGLKSNVYTNSTTHPNGSRYLLFIGRQVL